MDLPNIKTWKAGECLKLGISENQLEQILRVASRLAAAQGVPIITAYESMIAAMDLLSPKPGREGE